MILVTGGTGLVGSHLLYNLCKKESSIRATKREKSNLDLVKKVFGYYTDDPLSLYNKIEWVEADLLDLIGLEEAFNGITKVYHCAAWVSFTPKHKAKMLQTNISSTANIVNLCLHYNIEKLCYVSSVAAIGKPQSNKSIDETLNWSDGPENSNYALSKYNAELEVWRGIEEGLNAVIVNPAIILGPGDWNKGSSLLYDLIAKGMPFYTTGTNGFVDVRDVINTMISLMESSINGERFILCSESIPYKQTFDYIADAMGRKRPSIKVGAFLKAVGWRLAKIAALFTGKTPLVTKETTQAGSSVSTYENIKIKEKLNLKFIPVAQSCKDFSELYMKEVINK